MNNTFKLVAGLALSGLVFSANAQTTPAATAAPAQTTPAATAAPAQTAPAAPDATAAPAQTAPAATATPAPAAEMKSAKASKKKMKDDKAKMKM